MDTESSPVFIFSFLIMQGEDVHGVPGLINLFGIESPGLTSSLAIAEYVASKIWSWHILARIRYCILSNHHYETRQQKKTPANFRINSQYQSEFHCVLKDRTWTKTKSRLSSTVRHGCRSKFELEVSIDPNASQRTSRWKGMVPNSLTWCKELQMCMLSRLRCKTFCFVHVNGGELCRMIR